MSKKFERDALLADLASVEKILSRLPESDLMGRSSFESRRSDIQERLSLLGSTVDTLANVALFFNGDPVDGSRSIDAEFASGAINAFQEVISKKMSILETGGLSQVGRIPLKNASRLNITGIVHGSFGFVLEESDQDSPQLVNSSLKETVDDVTCMISDITDDDEAKFTRVIETMEPRLFSSMRRFFNIVHKGGALMRIIEGERDIEFDKRTLQRGYDRIEASDVIESDQSFEGKLIGVVPVSRWFEFRANGDSRVIRGKIGPMLSASFLERIENDENLLGLEWMASIRRKIVNKPDGKVTTSYLMLELKEADKS